MKATDPRYQDPRQVAEVAKVTETARNLLRGLPPDIRYVVLLVRPGRFGTIAANVDEQEKLDMLQRGTHQLRCDLFS